MSRDETFGGGTGGTAIYTIHPLKIKEKKF